MGFDEGQPWDAYLGHLSDQDKAIHAVLQDWFLALEDGTAEFRMPDPSYQRPEGTEPWTDARLAALLTEIDEYTFRQAAWVKTNRGLEFDAGPGYMRLGQAQRVAMAQDLERAILAHPDESKPYPVPKAEPPPAPLGSVGYEY